MKNFLKTLCLCAVVLSLFAVFCLINFYLCYLIMVNKDYLFYEFSQFSVMVMLLSAIFPTVFLGLLICRKLNLETNRQRIKNQKSIKLWCRLGYFRIPIIVIWVILYYFAFTSVNVVTENEIIVKSGFNPIGRSYLYSEVQEIYAGFGDKFISCNEYEEKGNFYYQITLDGKKIIFTAPSVNPEIERYEDNTYLELEEFDQKLCKLKIPKTSSSKFRDDSYYDKEIIERFIRIINNK